MRQRKRSIVLIGVTAAVCLGITAGGAAFAGPPSGVKGEPQPEAKPFRVSNQDISPASIAFEPNGSMVAAFDVTTKNAEVCLLNRGWRSCAHKLSLGVPSSHNDWDSVYGPHVFVPSANHVIVLGDFCCDHNVNDTLMYSSTDGGRTFGPLTRIGLVTVGGAVLIGKQIVFSGLVSQIGAAQVESVKVGASGPPAAVATVSQGQNVVTDVGIGDYRGGVLAAFDNDGKFWQTFVKYAPDHSDFNSSTSYKKVISISNEQLLGASGSALLTIQTTHKQAVELRLFNGKSFGSAHAVPGTSGGGPEWFGIEQAPGGGTHVFTERGFANYDLIEYSTSNGTVWTKRNLGNAIDSNAFSAGLDGRGTGLILGTLNHVTAYPVLQSQSVSFSLKSSSIRKGKSTTATGKGSPAGTGRLVVLQVERSGKWYDVKGATAHEKSNGSFSFTIKGQSVGKFAYRAVVSDLAGYLLFGYSNGRTLRVT
jgi:hypothetical protein